MLRNELMTLFRRRRSLGSLLALSAVPFLMAIALIFAGNGPSGEGPPFLEQVSANGYFLGLTGLAVTIPLLLPLVVSIVSGDMIAGEANLGTLRSLLVRPVSRIRLLLVKFVAALIFTIVAALTVVIAGLLAGIMFFGLGDVVTLSGVVVTVPEALLRAMLAALVVGLSMAGLVAVGLFISTLTDQPVAAVIVTLGVVVLSQILDSIPQLNFLHPILLTHYWLSFVDLFRVPIDFDPILNGLLLQLGWIAVFASAAWARLTTKDVLS